MVKTMDKKVRNLYFRLTFITWAFMTAVFLSLIGPGMGTQFYTTIIILFGVVSLVIAPFVAQINDMLQAAVDKIIREGIEKQ